MAPTSPFKNVVDREGDDCDNEPSLGWTDAEVSFGAPDPDLAPGDNGIDGDGGLCDVYVRAGYSFDGRLPGFPRS